MDKPSIRIETHEQNNAGNMGWARENAMTLQVTSKPFTSLDFLKHAPWLTAERITLWATAFSLAWIGTLAWDAITHTRLGVTNDVGEYFGRDFINYWSGARLAVQGRAAMAYDLRFFYAFQRAFAGPLAEWKFYGYPPVAMLLSAPLAGLPFMAALALWTVGGMGLCAFALSRRTEWRWAWRAAIGSPAAFLNFMGGQNGYFTAALLGSGLLLVERRPVLAGVLLGLLCYKPQMGLIIPVALLAGGHGRAFLSAAVTVTALVAASAFFLGLDAWNGFLVQMHFQRVLIMESNNLLVHRMPTVFCMVRLLGGGVGAAYGAQIVSALPAGVIVIILWWKNCALNVRVAAAALAAFLVTPYAWDYDMVVLIFAVVGLVQEGQRTGFLPWEKITWLAVVILPLPMMALGKLWGLPLGPPVLWLALLLVFRRGMTPEDVQGGVFSCLPPESGPREAK